LIQSRASNFLKHADRDPDAILEDVNEEINDSSIFLAIAYSSALMARTNARRCASEIL
jgi:hypothetical protein